MAKLDWGKKHICSECSTKFYDMNKPTPECPKCGSQIVISRKPRVGSHLYLKIRWQKM